MIEDWVRSAFDIVRSASGAEELVVCCPFCPHDTHYHLYISTIKPVANCYKCGWKGSWWSLIREVSGAESYAEIYRQLKQPTSAVRDYQTVLDLLDQRKEARNRPPLVEMPDWYKPFNPANQPYHAHIVLRYALKRMSYDTIVKYGLGYCDDINNPLALRLILPVERGYYQARAINGHATEKYLSTTSPIEDRLFNGWALDRFETVAICEGVISAIATGENAVATLGANGATNEQRRRLRRSKVKEFVLVVEPEQVAKDKAVELGDMLVDWGKRVRVRQFIEGDPADSDMYEEYDYSMLGKRRLVHA